MLFSAAYMDEGRAPALFSLAARGACTLVSSLHAIDEAERNLRQKRPQALERFGALLAAVRVVPDAGDGARSAAAGVGLDPGDVPILAAAIGRADMLVTGDRKHFGRWFGRRACGVRIIALADIILLLLDG